MRGPVRIPIRVAAAAAVVVLLGAVGAPSGGSAATTSPAPSRSHRAQTSDAILPGLQVSSQENTSVGIGGTVPTDWVTISGNDGEDGTGTSWLYGPIQPAPGATDCSAITDDQWENGPGLELFTYSIDGSVNSGNGRQWLSSVQMRRPGCYAWQHHIQLSPSGATADSSPAASGETFLIVQPQPTTTINTTLATVGSYLSDTLTLAGSYGRLVQVTGQLVRAAPRYVNRAPVCTGVPDQWANPTVVATIGSFTVIGDVQHPVPGSYQATTAGCYSFTFHVTELVARVGTASADVAAGEPAGTGLVDAPTVTTSTPGTVSPASSVASTVTIAGLHLPAGDTAVLRSWYLGNEAAHPAGPAGSNPCLPAAIRDQLPATGQPDQSGCTSTGWEGATIAGTLPALTITADGTHQNEPIIIPAPPGYGTFVQALTYNGVTALITAPGEPGAVVQAAAPSIATTASSAPLDATAGTANLSDALTVTGLHLQPGDHATITAHALTARHDANGCTDVDWANAAQAGSPTTLDISSDGHYITAPIAVQAGCHTFTETLSINGHHVSTNAEQPGQPGETMLTAPTSSPSPTPTPTSTSTPAPTHHAPASGTAAPPKPHVPQPRTAGGGGRKLATTGAAVRAIAIAGLSALALGAALAAGARRGRTTKGGTR